jgi:hypothetical protein
MRGWRGSGSGVGFWSWELGGIGVWGCVCQSGSWRREVMRDVPKIGYETGRRKERVESSSHIDVMSPEDWIERHGEVCKYVTCVVVWYASSVKRMR